MSSPPACSTSWVSALSTRSRSTCPTTHGGRGDCAAIRKPNRRRAAAPGSRGWVTIRLEAGARILQAQADDPTAAEGEQGQRAQPAYATGSSVVVRRASWFLAITSSSSRPVPYRISGQKTGADRRFAQVTGTWPPHQGSGGGAGLFFARESDGRGAFVRVQARAEMDDGNALAAGAHAKCTFITRGSGNWSAMASAARNEAETKNDGKAGR
jgi:hypothetical protein